MVAIGKANTAYMQTLVTQPSTDNFFPVKTFDGLTESFINGLIDDLCDATPAPAPPATPSPPAPKPPEAICELDTRAECDTLANLCFQNARGKTACKPSFDGKNTCWCIGEGECVHNRSMPLTRTGNWSVCRKSETDMRGEDNPVSWFFVVSLDIVT